MADKVRHETLAKGISGRLTTRTHAIHFQGLISSVKTHRLLWHPFIIWGRKWRFTIQDVLHNKCYVTVTIVHALKAASSSSITTTKSIQHNSPWKRM